MSPPDEWHALHLVSAHDSRHFGDFVKYAHRSMKCYPGATRMQKQAAFSLKKRNKF